METITRFTFFLGLFLALSGHAAVSGVNVVDGSRIRIEESGEVPTVYVFLSARCPCSKAHEGILRDLSREFSGQGVRFVGIHSNQNETPAETQKHFQASGLPFPVIEDENARIADEFRALKTPHVFVRKGSISLFEGGVDDTSSGVASKRHYLRDALREISSGKSVTQARARVLGCAIARSKS
jgi:hypothetical protein